VKDQPRQPFIPINLPQSILEALSPAKCDEPNPPAHASEELPAKFKKKFDCRE
jgi:hypothetical protein